MKKSFIILSLFFLLFSCLKDDVIVKQNEKNILPESKILILKVDFATNTLESGKELTFTNNSATFTTNAVATSNAADGGTLAINYQEINKQLFFGNQNWTGTIVFPEVWQPANTFAVTLTSDVFPKPIFLNIFNPNNEVYNYDDVWNAIQGRVKVREFLTSNPGQTAKIFKYSQYNTAGAENPNNKWIIILKK